MHAWPAKGAPSLAVWDAPDPAQAVNIEPRGGYLTLSAAEIDAFLGYLATLGAEASTGRGAVAPPCSALPSLRQPIGPGRAHELLPPAFKNGGPFG
ncbi:MAG: hypothetical protein HC915_14025, partial [Anaerolineae bacterium]|nr:hypothetical protein [Anaerolineae bacterium]